MKYLTANLQTATLIIEEMKQREPELRFRIETCVNKDSVKLYVIKKEKIQTVVTIDEGKPINIDEKEGVACQ